MPGPPPKPTAIRQRRNRTSTAATLGQASRRRRVQPLPIRRCPCSDASPCPECVHRGTRVLPWHHMTVSWWTDVWRSEMAPEYLDADVHRLYMLAVLVEQFWNTSDPEVLKEIRLQGQCFG